MNHEVNDIKPSSLSHIVGQRSVVDQVRVALDACFQDNRRMDHCLLVGPPGLGKSALANIVAQEMATEFHEVLGQSIVTPADLNALLLLAKEKSVIHIDEAHELKKEYQTCLYLALDQRKLLLPGGKNVQSLPLNDFTLLLSTTDEYCLLQPLRDRMRLVLRFTESNREPFNLTRVTTRDVTDFRSYLHREKKQAVASVNRALVLIRKFFDWAVQQNAAPMNPAKAVKELRRQQLAPKGLDRADVRRLLREIELRQDIRGSAIFHLLLYTGCRVSDLVNLELSDLMISERAGSVVFRHGKGNKQRTVPLPLAARKAMQVYLETRPPVAEGNVFIGERGPIGSVRLGESTFRCLPPARKHRLGSILPACGSSAD